MRKFLLMSLAALLVIAIGACGGAAESPAAPTNVPPTQAPPTDTPAAVEEKQEESSSMASGSEVSEKLKAYADENANGPGAIFIGDLSQLVGPAITEDQGDLEGNVPLDALEKHLFVFESDYYQGLLEQANVENPTEMMERD